MAQHTITDTNNSTNILYKSSNFVLSLRQNKHLIYSKYEILFLCRGNVGRSQIAEALFKKSFGNQHEIISAGTKLSGPEQPIGDLMPGIQEVLDVMKEEGIDVSMNVRKQLTEEMVESVDKVVAIMEEHEELPEYLINSGKLVRWNVLDPKGKDLGATREIKNKIKELIEGWE